MTSPLVHRELLVQGRYWGNYWQRVLVAGGGAAGLVIFWASQALRSQLGGVVVPPPVFAAVVLGSLHAVVSIVLGVGGAVLTADCLARERREGTLGLLFLTPLTPRDIAAGKCIAQILRLGSIWLAAVPLLAIPLLMGGVTPRNIIDALLVQFTLGCTGLAAGLLATALCREWRWAMFFACFWFAVLYGALAVVASVAFVGCVGLHTTAVVWDRNLLAWVPVMPVAMFSALPLEGVLGGIRVFAPGWVLNGARFAVGCLAVWSVGVVGGVGFILFRVLDHQRQGLPVPGLGGATRKAKPKERDRPAKMTRPISLERNPITWLETRGALANWAPWALSGAVVAGWLGLGVLTWMQSSPWLMVGWVVPPLLVLVSIFLAAAGLRQEHADGTLELLLCTPLPPRQLLTGRLCTVGSFILPPFLVASLFCACARPSAWRFDPISRLSVEVPAHVYLGPAWGFWLGACLLWLLCRVGDRQWPWLVPGFAAIRWVAAGLYLLGFVAALWWPDPALERSSGAAAVSDGVWQEAGSCQTLLLVCVAGGLAATCLALRCAVRRTPLLISLALAVVGGLILPYLLSTGISALGWAAVRSRMAWPEAWDEWATVTLAMPLQLGVASGALWLGLRDLRSREFQKRPLQRKH